MELKPGYKPTPVGVIPESWQVHPFSELLDFRNGVNADKHAYGKGVPFINVLEVITKSHLRKSDVPGRVSLARGVVDSYAVRRGDLLFNRTSETQEEVGLCSVFLDEDTVVFGGFVIRGRPTNATSIDAAYPGYAFRAHVIRAQIIAKGQGAIRVNIGQADLRQVFVPLPPLPEQCAVATALGDVDALVGALTQLIAKKRDLKLAARQQLLTGQTRLPGFSGEWEVKPLGDLGTWKGGATPSMSNPAYWTAGDVPWAASGDIKAAVVTETAKAITKIAVKESSTTLIEPGAILIVTRSGILRKHLPVARTTMAVAINQDIKALVPDESISPEFLLQALSHAGPNVLASCLKSGTTVESIEYVWLKRFTIALPERHEQTAIAAILGDMDDELAALEARLAKTRALKQGMMQELLTGRTRLV